MWKRIAYVIVGIAAIAAIIVIARQTFGVDRTVTIHYEQRGQCNSYIEGNRAISADRGAFVVFKVVDIDNRAKNAVDFDFEPEALYINNQPKDYTNSSFDPLAQQKAVPTTVLRGKHLVVNGYAVAIVEIGGPDPASVAVQTDYRLLYDHPLKPGQVVNLKKVGSGPPWGNWHTDCSLIIY